MPPLIIVALFISAGIVDYFTHFAEKSAGAYLNWRNSGREAWGTYWEKELASRQAIRKMEEESAATTRLSRQVELAENFTELFDLLPDGVGVPVTPSKFIELYRSFPSKLQSYMISQAEVANLYRGDTWQRCTIWRKDQNIVFYLIDSRNRIIKSVPISSDLLEAAKMFGKVTAGRLSEVFENTGEFHSGDAFFEAYFNLPVEKQKKILDPEVLLNIEKPVTQVGLSAIAESKDFIYIGFESLGSGGYQNIIYPVHRENIKPLLSALNPDAKTGKPDAGGSF